MARGQVLVGLWRRVGTWAADLEGLKGLWGCLGGGVRFLKWGRGFWGREKGELVEGWFGSSGDALPDEGGDGR